MQVKLRCFIRFDLRLSGYILPTTFDLMQKSGLNQDEIKRIKQYNEELKKRRNINL
jgi:hypothetical protein